MADRGKKKKKNTSFGLPNAVTDPGSGEMRSNMVREC